MSTAEFREGELALHRMLTRFIVLSLAAAVVTIVLKSLAAVITGSVGFLSDAMESGINLVAAAVALYALQVAARPPDAEHHFGHGNAEYVSAAVEGGMVFAAAAAIVWTSGHRLLNPESLDRPGVGLVLSAIASGINLVVGLALVRAGKRHRSITLTADGKHLLTDVWTSAGVLVGIALVALFDWVVLDPIVAILVGLNILHTGYWLLRRSLAGLLNAALPIEDVVRVEAVLDRYRAEHRVGFHALRTRESGRQRFVFVHLLVPGEWTVAASHVVSDQLELDIASELPGTTTFIHVEPTEDMASYEHRASGELLGQEGDELPVSPDDTPPQ
jgi:cation diffusion facilitator family transporter